MAGASDSSSKEDKTESRRDRAVSRYLVPILVGWLLAVAGLHYWDRSITDILEKAGKVAVLGSAAVAFLTVVLAAIQDMLPVDCKQRLLFPSRCRFPRTPPYPSYWAFSEPMLRKAKVRTAELKDHDGFKNMPRVCRSPKRQDRLWYAAYLRHKDEPAVAQFSARHIAWRDTVPLLIFLTFLTLVVGLFVESPVGWLGWGVLCGACFGLGWMCWGAGRGANNGLVIEVVKRLAREPKKAAGAASFLAALDSLVTGTEPEQD